MTTEMHEWTDDDKSSKAVLDRITIICTVLTITISAIILAGWSFNLFDITRSNPIYKPTSPGSAILFIFLGCALLVHLCLPVNHAVRKLAKVAVALTLVFALIILVDYITGYGFDIERIILTQPEIVNNVIIGRMSPIASVNFIISSLALLLFFFFPEGKQRAKGMAAYLASVSLYIAIIVFIGYLYGTPLFYGGTTIPSSLFTAITFILFSTAIITAAGMEYLPLRSFIGDSVQARLMRSFIPVIIAYILLEVVLKAVLLPYSDENLFHSSIIVIFFFIFGGLITSRIAQNVGGDVDRKDFIQRERAADVLRESESKFRTIFETVPDGLGLTRIKDGLLIEANNGLSQMFGYSKDEVVGKTIPELKFWVDPDDRTKMIEQLQSRGIAYGMEVKYRKKNGEISTGTYSAAKLLINNEPHLIILTRDISQSKHAEEMLTQSEEKYRGLIENIQDGIFIIQDAKLNFVNEAFARIAGYPVQEIIGMDFRDLVAQEDKELVVDRYTRRLRGEKVPSEYEFRLIRKDGTIVAVDMNVGAFTYFGRIASIGILKDITQRKLLDETLRQSEERYRTLVDWTPEAIVVHRGGKLIYVNPAAIKLIGAKSVKDLIGKPLLDLVHPDFRQIVLERTKNIIEKGIYPPMIEEKFIKLDGTTIDVEVKATSIIYDGELANFAAIHDITQSKRAKKGMEEAIIIAQSEKNKSEAIIAALGDGIIIQDTDYLITYQNKLQTDIYGEHAGEHCYKVYENRDTICEDCPVEKTFLDGKVHRTQRSVPIGGKMSHYELTSSPLRDSSGKIIAGVKMVRDITDLKLSEEKLREGEQFLESIIESIQDAIGIIDTEMNIIKVNKTCESWYPHAVPHIGKKCYEAYHNRKERCEVCPALETFRTGNSAYKVVPKHGPGGIEIGWLEIYSYPLRDTAIGQMKGVIEYVRDITQSKQAQEKLRKSEERFRKLVETEPECVKLLTQDNILIDMNPAGLGMIEADSLVQVAGKSIMGVIDPAYQKAFADAGRRVFKGESTSLEFRITGLKGTKRWLETHAVPLRDDFGKIEFLLAVTRDVTERKRAQEERIQLIEREQTALSEAEAARKLDRMKSMFIASTSHELRTPLNAIIGFSSLVLAGLSGELNPEQKMQIGIVHSSAKHLLALISDVIDLSKIEAGKIDVNISQFDLREIVDEVVTTLDSSIKEKRLNVRVEVENIPMRTDRMRLFQCLLNIIGNAVKYTENGSIKVSAKKRDNNIDISITDTGIGIKTEDIPRLFEPFVRLESPLTLKTSGTGLGLYLTKKLAKDFLRGDIDVKSEPGKGSTFILKIPGEIQ